jgi:predicted enzyme related to lactoylglutathione lyase
MRLKIEAIDIDTGDPQRIATFWAEALGWPIVSQSEDEWVLEAPEGSPEHDIAPALLFLLVPEGKSVKNRLHLDLRPDDQAAEVARLTGLGATTVDVGQGDVSWVVMADPDGNEFCVLKHRG